MISESAAFHNCPGSRIVRQFDVETALRRHLPVKSPLTELPVGQDANYFEFANRTSNNEWFPPGSGEKR